MTNIFYLFRDIFFAVGGMTRDWRPKNNLLSFGNLRKKSESHAFLYK